MNTSGSDGIKASVICISLCLQIRQQHRQLLHEHHQRFHAVWGQLLKTGYQNSRFAHQVERFACLYTSHVSNLAFYSPDKSYRYEHYVVADSYSIRRNCGCNIEHATGKTMLCQRCDELATLTRCYLHGSNYVELSVT